MALLNVGKAFLTIVPDVSQLKSELTRQVDPAVNSSMKKMGQKMQGVGLGLTAGLTVPLVAMGKSAVDAFQDAEKVTAQVNSVIQSTGGAAGVTADQVDSLAQSISGYSGIDDEAIKSADALLLTFTNVRNEAGKGNDIFDRATTIMADMSTALGTDAKGSAIQLGKALNDPVKGITALSRVGVSFSQKQKDVIARLVKTGDTAGAQRVILDELTKEFGGSAKAFGDTSAGAAAKSKVAWGNAMEDIGAALAPVMTTMANLIGKLAGWFSSLPAGAKTAIVIIGALLAVLGPVVSLIGTIITIAPAVGTAFTVMLGPVGLIIIAIAALIALVIVLIKNWDTIKRVAGAVWRAITGAVKAAVGKIKDFFVGIIDWFKQHWPLILTILTGPFGLAVWFVVRNWQKIKDTARAVIDWLRDAWHTVADVVHNVWSGIASFVRGVWDGIIDAAKRALNFLIDGLNVFVNGINTVIHGVNLVKPGADIANIPPIQHLAAGGIITRPTIALLGEAGPEAVVPLRGHGGPVEIVGRLTIDEDGFATIRAVVREEQARGAAWSRNVRANR